MPRFAMLTEFTDHWIAYSSIVVLAALIGWVTKIVAIEMMFKPIDFKGFKIGPLPIGWQGIIPLRAAHMASVATNKIVGELLTPADVWARLDQTKLLAEIREPLLTSMDAITQEVASTMQPEIWANTPGFVKDKLIQRMRDRGPDAMKQIMDDVEANVEEVLDLKSLATRTLVYDKEILQRVFRQAGKREWAFIRRFGLVAGFFIGLLQLTFYLWLRSPLINPIMGAINGWATDAFCIKVLLFSPKRPKKYLGIFTWQGLFLKYQDEVADELSALIAEKVLTPHAILESMLKGPLSDRFYLIIRRHVGRMVEEELGVAAPAVRAVIGADNLDKTKTLMAERVMNSLPRTMENAEGYIEDTLDVANLLAERLKELPPEEFEGVLRPAFQQDEWILIATGAVLGAFAGVAQDVVIHQFAK
ncbi:DUF445 domain-containing protein [Antrihabitans sp. YC3-6]|uniref:DUF445 domain-containing protein n=1 Tax=Antrihabitans stalagmiti TaxID=2799499 RepID=A0A934NPB1_9NOCA|nr:DUF445 domain-containing protein [Antrihabitans stalagmiti]MBJ8338810.1 DUF445 domain-containing protein [Antrihabitans stalagmiti]